MWNIINFFQYLFVVITIIFNSTITIILLIFRLKKVSTWFIRNTFAKSILFVCGVRSEVKGLENLNNKIAYLIICNHLSQFDIIILLSVLPFPVYFVAKKELRKIPFLGIAMKAYGMVFIDRQNHLKAMKCMEIVQDSIKAGKNIITFPEGTRSKTGSIGLYKKGSFVIANSCNCPILPIAIKGTYEVMRKGSLKIRPGKVILQIGKPFNPLELKNNDPVAMAKYAQSLTEELIARLN